MTEHTIVIRLPGAVHTRDDAEDIAEGLRLFLGRIPGLTVELAAVDDDPAPLARPEAVAG
ncbi:MAG: hypothetical protein IH609_11930 [Dehalococcoidia bacterium]|nr:hypothetical protein [Dehalococcoidia bacterium]